MVLPRGQYWVRSCSTSSLINGLDDGAEHTLSKLADDTRLGGVVLRPGGCAAILRHLGRLERWADRDLMQFSKGKCKGCCAGDEHRHRLPREPVESPSLEMFPALWTWSWTTGCRLPCLSRGVGPSDFVLQVTSRPASSSL